MVLCTSDSHLQSCLLKSREQEDHGLKPALSKLFARIYLKNTEHKEGLLEWFMW
jgi:hypothetical protein